MSARTNQAKDELIDRVAAIVRDRLKGGDAGRAEEFMRAYYANVPPADLAGANPETLYGAAVSFWQFGRKRAPGAPKIRIINPRLDEHGWKSAHTVIEIVNDDMPFLVDSVTGELNRAGLTVHLVIHPILWVKRSDAGAAQGLAAEASDGGIVESHMHFEIDEQTSADVLAGLEDNLTNVLDDVRAAVADWRTMRDKMMAIVGDLLKNPPDLPREHLRESMAFLEWLAEDHFTFMGFREYRVTGRGEHRRLDVADGGLGILRDPGRDVFENWRDLGALAPQVRAHVEAPTLLIVTKGNQRSTVHRTVYLDVVAVKRFDAKGRLAGQLLFTGLFTSAAYSRSPHRIPLLRHKVANTLARCGLPEASHDRKALAHILDSYPRDELLQCSEDELFANAMGIVDMQERQRVRLFVRRDPFERFMTAIVYVPRERYNAEIRRRIGDILAHDFGGSLAAFYPHLATDSVLAQVLFIITTVPGKIPDFHLAEVEARLAEAARTWADRLQTALVESKGEEAGLDLFRRFGAAFSPGYRDAASPAAAVNDVAMIDAALGADVLGINLYRHIEDPEHAVWLKLFHTGGPIALSDVLPMLEHMGLRVIAEFSFEVTPADGSKLVWIHDFEMESRNGAAIDLALVEEKFEAAFARVWRGEIEDDGFNRLVIGAELRWRDVVVLRAFCKYLRQAGIAFSQAYMEETMAANPLIARLIIDMFEARFNPERQRMAKRRVSALRAAIEGELDQVMNLDEDRIIRRFVNLVDATLRTNFYQPGADGAPKPYVSFKLDSAAIDELPAPRPWREIFVYSPRMEGIHLRGGTVARGGLRWSDRREDFRTEVLGLMKAQMVKNAVIVPVGSKGGFVCKCLPPIGPREAVQEEVVACYKTLIRGMLDLTDNLVDDDCVPPDCVVRLDEDDPYLVVAADKGTATFSDIANGVSAEYGFWLGDAFASGGSAGYDHKKMGITARGTWESVKRHFRERGLDTQSQDFTVVGVGDMSGDVFGNGMLLSEHIRLLAAFNHMHIFIDPDPDAKTSHAERRRLFDLPRSGWSDYDPALISKGGGVFDRKAKSVKVTPEMKARIGLAKDSMTPNELIRALLKAQVDLLWFGGIGTYLKAKRESDLNVGDRANDATRISAHELGCKVIGEGANLAVTQLARIEFAQAGGGINTDFIDNSAGVDTSDHEVNIKIVLDGVVAAGDMTGKQRDKLLASMTDEIGRLVLNDNYLQSQAISHATSLGAQLLDEQWRLMRALERAGRLDRAIEFLPDDEEMATRKTEGTGLSRPEYAVLLAYAKIALYDDLLPTSLPDDAYLVRDLARYFPAPLRKAHDEQISQHRLRREITTTYITNSLINRAGATFVHEIEVATGAEVADVVRAYIVARDAFQLRPLWRAIESLDNKVPAAVQDEMLRDLERLVRRSTLWLLRHTRAPLEITQAAETYAPGVAELARHMSEIVAADDEATISKRADKLAQAGVPNDLARRIAGLEVMESAFDIVRIAAGSGVPVHDVARVYFSLGERLMTDWLRQAARTVTIEDEWQRQAVAAIIDESFASQADLTVRVLDVAGRGKLGAQAASGVIDVWLDSHRAAFERARQVYGDLRAVPQLDLAMLTIANQQIKALITE